MSRPNRWPVHVRLRYRWVLGSIVIGVLVSISPRGLVAVSVASELTAVPLVGQAYRIGLVSSGRHATRLAQYAGYPHPGLMASVCFGVTDAAYAGGGLLCW
jgi:hypothetical protein